MNLSEKIFGKKGDLTQKDIEKYFSGKVSPKEQHDIEAKSLQNELFSDAIDGFSFAEKLDITNLKLKAKKKLFRKPNNISYFIAIAAILAFVIIFFLIPINKNHDTISENILQKKANNESVFPTKTIVNSIVENSTTDNLNQKKQNLEISKQTKNIKKPNTKSLNTLYEVAETKLLTKKDVLDEIILNSKKEKYVVAEEQLSAESPNLNTITNKNASTIYGEAEKLEEKSGQNFNLITDNFPITYLADLKIANYDGKRLNLDNLDNKKSEIPNSTSAKFSAKEMSDKEEDVTIKSEKTIHYNNFLEKGLYKLKKQKYTEAIDIFNTILIQYPEDINAKFYKGICYFELKKFEKAISNFNLVLNDTINIFNQEANWKKALSLINTNKDEGIKLLIEIQNEAGFYSQKAILKLEGIKNEK
jgi:tetratricopeptide (TPR) repeat protein